MSLILLWIPFQRAIYKSPASRNLPWGSNSFSSNVFILIETNSYEKIVSSREDELLKQVSFLVSPNLFLSVSHLFLYPRRANVLNNIVNRSGIFLERVDA